MAIEIEAKMPLKDVAGLIKRLKARKARRGRTVLEVNTFFDTPQQALKAADRGLRLRVEREIGGRRQVATVTHKGPRVHGRLKNRAETEFQVDDADQAAELLAALGYAPFFSFEKRRQYWELNGCQIALDRLPYLGDFVEIEGPSEKRVLATRHRLELVDLPMLTTSYIALLMDYLEEHHLKEAFARLEETPT